MNYRRYHRSVTVFVGQNRDFSIPGREAGGNLKIETGNERGAMRCNLTNLQPYAKGDYLYKLILFGVRNERTIHAVIGTVPVNRSGTGDAYFRFDPINVNGKGDEYEYFTTAIVAAVSQKSDQEPLHPVLKGDLENKPVELLPQQPEAAAQRKNTGRSDIEQQKTERAEREQRTAMQRRAEASAQREPAKKKQEAPKPVVSKVFNHFYNEYLLHFCAQICRTADCYEEVWPFAKDRTGARWKKIRNAGTLPLVSPGAHYFAGLYRHYLFGARPDGWGRASCYFFGIPGQNNKTEQPDGGRSGFLYWQPAEADPAGGQQAAAGQGREENPHFGYWIVEIDVQTGDIREVTIEKEEKM